MPRSSPTTLALPPFAGATRRLILICVGVFFTDALLSWVLPRDAYAGLLAHLVLVPSEVVHGQVWQIATYAFLPMGITGSLFALLTLWFIGAMLEELRGPRWLYELFFTSALGGAIVATGVSYTHLFHLSPNDFALGLYAAVFGLLVAVAKLMGDTEFFIFFLIKIKAKYLVTIYILVDIATVLKTADGFSALLNLSGALCGFLFLRFVTRRGLTASLAERYFGMRNDYYRSKRRRAAKKFEVYMSKQGRDDLHFDKDGRYVDPDKDPTDKRWMN